MVGGGEGEGESQSGDEGEARVEMGVKMRVKKGDRDAGEGWSSAACLLSCMA